MDILIHNHTTILVMCFRWALFGWLLVAVCSRRPGKATPLPSGKDGLCVVGCTPYVDPSRSDGGIEKYHALIEEMARTCDVIVHVGDTKAGRAPCNETLMTYAVHSLIRAGKDHDTLVLYAPGDNELNDCHRHASAPENDRVPSQIVKAVDARDFLLSDLNVNSKMDLTGTYPVQQHTKHEANLATCLETDESCRPYSCDFDKYVEFDDFAVATLEVIGSHWYLDDERFDGYPGQDDVDPLKSRFALYVNAKDCAVEWIAEVAKRAHTSGKSAVFFMFHATFYHRNGVRPMSSGAIGEYYNRRNLTRLTQEIGDEVGRPYYPLFDALRETALQYPTLMFEVVHSDAHKFLSTRLLPQLNNGRRIQSHHNLMIHQVEGASRALTMFSRFTVDPNKFQPVTLHQEWSRAAYELEPIGHSMLGY